MFSFVKHQVLPPPLNPRERSLSGMDEWRLGFMIRSLEDKGVGIEDIAHELNHMLYLAPGESGWVRMPQPPPQAVLKLKKGQSTRVGNRITLDPQGLVSGIPPRVA